MSEPPLEQHRKWREDLILSLRMKDVPGDRIGDILLEVDSHTRETGESPEEAFGSPKTYAAAYLSANPARRAQTSSMWELILIGVSSFAGTALFTSGAMALGQGSRAIFEINAWVATLIGIALITITLVRLPLDLIRHPATGALLFGELRYAKPITMAVILGIGVMFYLAGRLLA